MDSGFTTQEKDTVNGYLRQQTEIENAPAVIHKLILLYFVGLTEKFAVCGPGITVNESGTVVTSNQINGSVLCLQQMNAKQNSQAIYEWTLLLDMQFIAVGIVSLHSAADKEKVCKAKFFKKSFKNLFYMYDSDSYGGYLRTHTGKEVDVERFTNGETVKIRFNVRDKCIAFYTRDVLIGVLENVDTEHTFTLALHLTGVDTSVTLQSFDYYPL
mmetsp:Transcript_58857/g.93600  ORF Transcript_58857/g.93600 Transcript_58857/m.93600 type:complete len:214 (-) Transcript_58857:96-737(-)